MSNKKSIKDWTYVCIIGLGALIMIIGVALAFQSFIPELAAR